MPSEMPATLRARTVSTARGRNDSVVRAQLVVEAAHRRRPAQRNAVEFAHLAVVDIQALSAGLQPRFGPGLGIGRAFGKCHAGHAQRLLASVASGRDHELDELRLAQAAVNRRTPGELDMAAADRQVAEPWRQHMVRPVHPPDVVAAGIDQLELEVVGGAGSLDARDEIEALGPGHRQRTTHHRVAGDAGKVRVQAQAAVAVGAQARTHLVGRGGRPGRHVAEIVEQLLPQRRGLSRCGGDMGRDKQRDEQAPRHLTLPISRPCM